EMWKDLVDWGSNNWLNGGRRLADESDLTIPVCVDTVAEACQIIEDNLKSWEVATEDEAETGA
ncbi:MAG: LOG family protein, partial [Gemmatimonadota bacterium]